MIKLLTIQNLFWSNGSYTKPNTISEDGIDADIKIDWVGEDNGFFVYESDSINYVWANNRGYFAKKIRPFDVELKIWEYGLTLDIWSTVLKNKAFSVKGRLVKTNNQKLVKDNLGLTDPILVEGKNLEIINLDYSKKNYINKVEINNFIDCNSIGLTNNWKTKTKENLNVGENVGFYIDFVEPAWISELERQLQEWLKGDLSVYSTTIGEIGISFLANRVKDAGEGVYTIKRDNKGLFGGVLERSLKVNDEAFKKEKWSLEFLNVYGELNTSLYVKIEDNFSGSKPPFKLTNQTVTGSTSKKEGWIGYMRLNSADSKTYLNSSSDDYVLTYGYENKLFISSSKSNEDQIRKNNNRKAIEAIYEGLSKYLDTAKAIAQSGVSFAKTVAGWFGSTDTDTDIGQWGAYWNDTTGRFSRWVNSHSSKNWTHFTEEDGFWNDRTSINKNITQSWSDNVTNVLDPIFNNCEIVDSGYGWNKFFGVYLNIVFFKLRNYDSKDIKFVFFFDRFNYVSAKYDEFRLSLSTIGQYVGVSQNNLNIDEAKNGLLTVLNNKYKNDFVLIKGEPHTIVGDMSNNNLSTFIIDVTNYPFLIACLLRNGKYEFELICKSDECFKETDLGLLEVRFRNVKEEGQKETISLHNIVNESLVLNVFGNSLPLKTKSTQLINENGETPDLKIKLLKTKIRHPNEKWCVELNNDFDNIRVIFDVPKATVLGGTNLLTFEELNIRYQENNRRRILENQSYQQNKHFTIESNKLKERQLDRDEGPRGLIKAGLNSLTSIASGGASIAMGASSGNLSALAGGISSIAQGPLGLMEHFERVGDNRDNYELQKFNALATFAIEKNKIDLEHEHRALEEIRKLNSLSNNVVTVYPGEIDVLDDIKRTFNIAPIHINKFSPSRYQEEYLKEYYAYNGYDIAKNNYLFNATDIDKGLIIRYADITNINGITSVNTIELIKDLFLRGFKVLDIENVNDFIQTAAVEETFELVKYNEKEEKVIVVKKTDVDPDRQIGVKRKFIEVIDGQEVDETNLNQLTQAQQDLINRLAELVKKEADLKKIIAENKRYYEGIATTAVEKFNTVQGELTDTTKQVQNKEKALEACEVEKINLKEAKSELEKKLSDAQQTLETTQAKIVELNKQIKELNDKSAKNQIEVIRIQTALTKEKKKTKELEAEKEQINRQLQARILRLENEEGNIRNQLNLAIADKEEAKKEAAESTEVIKQLNTQIEMVKAQNAHNIFVKIKQKWAELFDYFINEGFDWARITGASFGQLSFYLLRSDEDQYGFHLGVRSTSDGIVTRSFKVTPIICNQIALENFNVKKKFYYANNDKSKYEERVLCTLKILMDANNRDNNAGWYFITLSGGSTKNFSKTNDVDAVCTELTDLFKQINQ